MKGQCLCGTVEFEISVTKPGLYQCHCALCRKVTGSVSSTATWVDKANFRWLAGEQNITLYRKPTGFRSIFCRTCGSPVPGKLGSTHYYWIPAGLLADADDLYVVAHLCITSRAGWAAIQDVDKSYDSMPAFDVFYQLLHRDS